MLQIIKTRLLCICILFLQGCATASVLRTAQVLEKNQFEISGGVAKSELGENVTQVVIAAYGITNCFEIEGRWEDEYISLTPRLQLLKSADHWIDCLAFLEVGYGRDVRWLGGGGIMLGKRFYDFSPYIAYKYRHYQDSRNFSASGNTHHIKLGGRYYLPPVWKRNPSSKSAWFIGAEGGPTILSHDDVVWEWAANIGFNF